MKVYLAIHLAKAVGEEAGKSLRSLKKGHKLPWQARALHGDTDQKSRYKKKILSTVRHCEEAEKGDCTNVFTFQVTAVNDLGLQTTLRDLMVLFLLPLNNF